MEIDPIAASFVLAAALISFHSIEPSCIPEEIDRLSYEASFLDILKFFLREADGRHLIVDSKSTFGAFTSSSFSVWVSVLLRSSI